jgi:hypothetical protein
MISLMSSVCKSHVAVQVSTSGVVSISTILFKAQQRESGSLQSGSAVQARVGYSGELRN